MPVGRTEFHSETDRLLRLIRSTSAAIGVGIMMLQISLIAVIVIVWTGTERLNLNNRTRAELTGSQIACFNIVQANFVSKIGALADTNGRQLRGEPADPVGNRMAVEEMRVAGILIDHLSELCYTDSPDKTPLDGDPAK